MLHYCYLPWTNTYHYDTCYYLLLFTASCYVLRVRLLRPLPLQAVQKAIIDRQMMAKKRPSGTGPMFNVGKVRRVDMRWGAVARASAAAGVRVARARVHVT